MEGDLSAVIRHGALGLRPRKSIDYKAMSTVGKGYSPRQKGEDAIKAMKARPRADANARKRKSIDDADQAPVKRSKSTGPRKATTISFPNMKIKGQEKHESPPFKKSTPERQPTKNKTSTRIAPQATKLGGTAEPIDDGTDKVEQEDGLPGDNAATTIDDDLQTGRTDSIPVPEPDSTDMPLKQLSTNENLPPPVDVNDVPSSPLSSVPSDLDVFQDMSTIVAFDQPSDGGSEELDPLSMLAPPEELRSAPAPQVLEQIRSNHKAEDTTAQVPDHPHANPTSTRLRRIRNPVVRYGSFEEAPTFDKSIQKSLIPVRRAEEEAHCNSDLHKSNYGDARIDENDAYSAGSEKAKQSVSEQFQSDESEYTIHVKPRSVVGPRELSLEDYRTRTKSMEDQQANDSEIVQPEQILPTTPAKRPRLDPSHTGSGARRQSKMVVMPYALSPRNKMPGLSLDIQQALKKPLTSRKKALPKKQATLNFNGLTSPASSQPDQSYETTNPSDSVSTSRLQTLSEKMSHREAMAMKPAPRGQPLVWADSRQALCETVPYFRMPQSGCHQNDRHVYAFLFDGVGHGREYMDPDVIISRAGGGMEADSTGQLVQKKDHLLSESQVQSVLNDIEHQNPLVIICGNKNEGSPVKMPHRYNVLGWYKPVSVWAEKTLGKGKKRWTTIKYRFERLHPETDAWHAPTNPLLTEDEKASAGSLVSQTCVHCDRHYPMIYLVGWMCLNPDCEGFWKLQDGQEAPCGKLHYNPWFLLSRTPWESEEEPYSVRPPIPDVGKVVGDNLTHINTRGICCPNCGRCSSRRLFRGWKCDNPHCDFLNFPKHIPVRVPMLHQPWEGTGVGPSLARNKHEKAQGVNVTVSLKFGFKVYTYTFDGIDGKFVHAVSNAQINRQPNGPDEMFAAMQDQDDPGMDLHLERRRFAIARGAGGEVADAPTKTSAGRQTAAATVPVTPTTASFAQQNESLLQADSVGGPAAAFQEKSASLTRSPPDPLLNEDQSQSVIIDTSGDQQGSEDHSEAADSQPRQGPGRPSLRSTPALESGDFMTAFSMNYGMPYKFVASGASLPFADAPWPVRTCRADLNWASQNFLDPHGHTDLNEELIFAYLQGQKIEYHDDGESGLGPRIATLSLGGPAQMLLRLKTKHHVGCSKTGLLTAERPVPGSVGGRETYGRRIAAWQALQALRHTDRAAYERRRREIPRELGLYEQRTKKAPDLLAVTLRHGDLVLMEGYEIQRYLEHKVVPEGVLRFAVTCRTVLPEHLREEERPAYEVGPDEEGMSGLRRMAGRVVEEEREKEKEKGEVA